MISGPPSRDGSLAATDRLGDTIVSILRRARELDRPSSDIADEMALERIRAAGRT